MSADTEPRTTPKSRAVSPAGHTASSAGRTASSAGHTASSGGRTSAVFTTIIGPVVVFIGFLVLWYLYSGLVLTQAQRDLSLPYFHDVIRVAFFNSEHLSELVSALLVTTAIAAVGLVISIVAGVAVAILMSQARWIENSLYPYAVLLQTIPILALVPVIGLRFGYGIHARILVVVIFSSFPIITNTLFGLKSVDKSLLDLFRLYNASRWDVLKKLRLPAALPAIFTGFQISAGLAVVGAIVGGFFFGRGPRDLGNRIQLYTNQLHTERLIAAVGLSALLGVFVFVLFGWLNRRMTSRWNRNVTSSVDNTHS